MGNKKSRYPKFRWISKLSLAGYVQRLIISKYIKARTHSTSKFEMWQFDSFSTFIISIDRENNYFQIIDIMWYDILIDHIGTMRLLLMFITSLLTQWFIKIRHDISAWKRFLYERSQNSFAEFLAFWS